MHGAMRPSADGRHRDRGRATERVRLGRCGARGEGVRCESPLWTSIRREFTFCRAVAVYLRRPASADSFLARRCAAARLKRCTVTLHTANTAPRAALLVPLCAASVEPIDLRPLVTVSNSTLGEGSVKLHGTDPPSLS